MKKFRPILFSTPMVQAILEGRKTQTRRTKGLELISVNSQDWQFVGKTHEHDVPYPIDKGEINYPWYQWNKSVGKSETFIAQCPYGNIGDVLWVREKHLEMIDCKTGEFAGWFYYADMEEGFHKEYPRKWKPSIHMPKAACRLFLRIKDVRVERLNEISEADAVAEGVFKNETNNTYKDYFSERGFYGNAVSSFRSLWASINGAESWNANPWVWVIEFERIEKPLYF